MRSLPSSQAKRPRSPGCRLPSREVLPDCLRPAHRISILDPGIRRSRSRVGVASPPAPGVGAPRRPRDRGRRIGICFSGEPEEDPWQILQVDRRTRKRSLSSSVFRHDLHERGGNQFMPARDLLVRAQFTEPQGSVGLQIGDDSLGAFQILGPDRDDSLNGWIV